MVDPTRKRKKKGFDPWPPPQNNEASGPSPRQRLLFIDSLPDVDTFLEDSQGKPVNIRRPHYHTQDVVLFIGGSGSGKSIAAIARVLSLCVQYPGTKVVVGSLNQKILERNLKGQFKDRLSIGNGSYNHPLIKRGPTDKRNTIEFKNGSEILFLNLSDPDVIRGLNADVIFVDECNLLPSGDSIDELLRRLRLHNTPLKQLILTMNPEKSNGWPHKKFHLYQYERPYIERGGKPVEVAARCKCQFCFDCLNAEKGEFPWNDERKCPNCGREKPSRVGYKGKVFDCPGDQQFFRVIRIKSHDNKHNPPDFVQNQKSMLHEDAYKRFVEGEIGECREGKCYTAFSYATNVLEKNANLDPNKDLIWACDWNPHPQCSVVVQETSSGAVVLDNIIGWDKDADDVARMLIDRFPRQSFTGTVHVYGDANGFWGQGSSKRKTNYQIIWDVLTEAGYKVVLHVTKNRNPSVVDRINCVNTVLKAANGAVRLMISPKAEHLIASLSETIWNPSTGKEDQKIDKNAKRADNKELPMGMTHPSCALGYYIEKAFPIIQQKPPVKFVVIPEKETVVQDSDGKIVSISPPVPRGKEKQPDPPKGSLHKTLLERNGTQFSRRTLRERLAAEQKEAEEREKRIAEKLQSFGQTAG